MAEVKNSFLQSKMNKDLDDRLIPNGEYRDALNISVGKAEDKDIGALEAVLGNSLLFETGNTNLKCIGQIADNQNNRIIQFWSDYLAPDGSLSIPSSGDMRITSYNIEGGVLSTLVSGVFLNFATNNAYQVIGVNIVENLLFWTDNRNQPRKINITKALDNPSYYQEEVQISVAKYAPVTPISVYLDIPVTTIGSSTSSTPTELSITVSTADAAKLNVGMQLITDVSVPALDINDYAVIVSINYSTGVVKLTVPSATTIAGGSTINFFGTSMTNQADDPNWPGDPNYLKDKFIRFSYRYKFDDGEYSLMAPFTQVLFIPSQNGYFLNGDEDAAYRSTVVSWMENYINNIDLYLELPDKGNNVANSYKISSVDILYKESDALTVKVLETVGINQIASIAGDTNVFSYSYKSQKPYKTLPESQTVRVYDKVPIRARAQEVVGNRVIYGNFVNQSTPPSAINYNLAIIKKSDVFTSWAEYPNHTLKQNRNYQAGIILADKFGRQSSVILSTNDVGPVGSDYKGSTIYSSYWTDADNLNVKDWRGNTLAMVVNSPISSLINEGAGTPGLYATVAGNIDGSSDGFEILTGTVTGSTLNYTLAASPAQRNRPAIGNYLRGKYTDYVKVTSASNTVIVADGDISDIYNSTGEPLDIKFSYSINPLGWYSYKIVVRQQQQDYYNVYLPGMLNGYPSFQTFATSPDQFTVFPSDEDDKTAHIVLLNDNINKVPRDLTEVGPDQKQYRSSVELFGRVENVLDGAVTTNKQYYPARKADVASTIANSSDLNFLSTNTSTNPNGSASLNLYQLSTNPIIARVSTVNKIGVIGSIASPPTEGNSMIPYLSVYETTPVVSLLDLFWETSTAGLVSDLNYDILNGSEGATGFLGLEFNHNEAQDPSGADLDPTHAGEADCRYITTPFEFANSSGVPLSLDSVAMTVVDLTGANRTTDFALQKFTTGLYSGKYAIKILTNFVFLKDAASKESYIFTFNIVDSVNGNTTLTLANSLTNIVPEITYPVDLDLISIPEVVLGPIVSCLGVNGAFETGTPDFNETKQLQWSIVDDSSTPGWEAFFSINETTGVLSLINDLVGIGTDYNLTIRLTDAYNYTTSSASPGSLYDEIEITVVYPVADNYCSDWSSLLTRPGLDVTWNNRTYGSFNFWKLMRPGETIDVVNTNVQIDKYSVGPDGTIEYELLIPEALVFSGSNYSATFDFTLFQDTDDNPTYALYLTGVITTNTGRAINIDIVDVADLPITGLGSGKDTCVVYIPTVNKSWRLINENPSTTIRWQALSSTGGSVIGGTLIPGAVVSSVTYYGGTYPCIRENTLTYSSGGAADYQSC